MMLDTLTPRLTYPSSRTLFQTASQIPHITYITTSVLLPLGSSATVLPRSATCSIANRAKPVLSSLVASPRPSRSVSKLRHPGSEYPDSTTLAHLRFHRTKPPILGNDHSRLVLNPNWDMQCRTRRPEVGSDSCRNGLVAKSPSRLFGFRWRGPGMTLNVGRLSLRISLIYPLRSMSLTIDILAGSNGLSLEELMTAHWCYETSFYSRWHHRSLYPKSEAETYLSPIVFSC